MRNLANAARLIEEHPQLMQLRVPQAMAGGTGNTLVLGMPPNAPIIPTPRPAVQGKGPPAAQSADDRPE